MNALLKIIEVGTYNFSIFSECTLCFNKEFFKNERKTKGNNMYLFNDGNLAALLSGTLLIKNVAYDMFLIK
jgi:hypothetical protein